MKKILLATTGLVGAALVAGAASAETPKVTLGGYADFQAGYTSDDFDTNRRSLGFRNDNEITIHVDGKTDGGLGYGAVVDLEADIQDDADNQGTNAARTFTYLEGGWGRFELGGNKDAAANLRVDASTLAVATGGINGSWTYFVNPDNNATAATPAGNAAAAAGEQTVNPYITTSKLTGEHGSMRSAGNESTYNATKVTYYTPRWYGLQGGVSYTPDLSDRGQSTARADFVGTPAFNGTEFGDVWDLALNYENQFSNGIKLAASAAYETGSADTTNLAVNRFESISAWNVGALLGYQGFSVAGSYGDWNDTGMRSTAAGNKDSDYYTLGAAYEGGPFGVSATYLDSSTGSGVVGTQDNDFENLVLGADYKLAPGLTPYAEVSFYEYDSAGVGNDNDGTVFILGTQLAF